MSGGCCVLFELYTLDNMLYFCILSSWALVSARQSGGGRISEVGEWTDTTWTDNPFMARLDISKDDASYVCGGSIIATKEWNGKGVILTAAHCVEGADNVNVWIGCTSTMCQDSIASGFNDDHFVIHPDYDADIATSDVRWCNNDVALIFLRKAITVEGATSIALHHDLNVVSNDDEVTVYGYWGSCEGSTGCVGGSDVDTLEMAAIHYLPSNQCDDIYGRHVTSPHDFCVVDDVARDGLQGVCMGDSGSPAVFEGKQIGLNSWGPGDCDPRYPTVLTSVPFYYEWIAEQCPECVGDDGGIQSGENGVCEGVQSRFDRICSRKLTETTCSAVRRGTVCQWVSALITDNAAHHTLKSAVFDLEKVVSLSDDVVAKKGKLEVSPLDVMLLIALAMTMLAVSLQLGHWYRRWRERRGYVQVQAMEEELLNEEGQKAFKIHTARAMD